MRIIAHLDMDAFYAAVEEQRNPALRGVPVAVGADPKQGRGRGVVTTANYIARRFGIHSALPISRAWRLAEEARLRGEPATVFLPPNFALYREISARVMQICERRAEVFEEASIDEAYLDLSRLGSWDAAAREVRNLKQQIREQEGLSCSVGIGPNKLIAKIASGYQKPDGLTVVTEDGVIPFLNPLSVRAIPGIGPKAEALLAQRGIRTVADLSAVSQPQLVEWFGKWGARLFEKARGVDESAVSNEWTRKSIGEQETFPEDTDSPSLVTERLFVIAERLNAKLRKNGFAGFRTVTLTVRFADFQTANRSRTMKPGIIAGENGEGLRPLQQEALKLLLPFLDSRENPRRKSVRLIGLRLENLF